MRTVCPKCSVRYDDADCDTICPHPRLRSLEMEKNWKLGYALLGKTVRFNHMPPGSGSHCNMLTFEGMVGIEGFPGEFAPHLFQIDEASITCPVCRRTSFNKNDVEQKYCGFCHRFHDEILQSLPQLGPIGSES
jgi:hypothetical protein